ncbi:hypothetical protein EJ07DRAFT_163870 [Lizonia empirigonia]|nr:hypothetical protein EJ07DRAFT_163870 [Lizonia empirigonia]
MVSSLFLSTALLSALSIITCATVKDVKSGCGGPLPTGIELDKSVDLTINSLSGVPLILSFHGRGKNAKFEEELSQFSNATYGFDGISVYPEGVPTSSGTQQFQGDPDFPSSVNDVTFTLELLDEIQKTYCIDPARIYAVGKSNGGGFTTVLACDADATKRIAAFAPVSGAIYLNADQKLPACNPSRLPIPIMEFHGFKDTTIPYAGGINTRGNANSTNVVAANKTSYLCSGSKKVTRYSWNETIPSSFPNGDTENALTCQEAEATSIILEWFKKWTL